MYALYIYDPLWVFVWFSYPTYWILFFFQKRNCSLSCVVRTFSLVNGVVHCSGFFILMAFHFTYFSLFISMYWKNRHWHYWKIVLCLIDWVKKIEKGVFIIRNDSTSNLKKKQFFLYPRNFQPIKQYMLWHIVGSCWTGLFYLFLNKFTYNFPENDSWPTPGHNDLA